MRYVFRLTCISSACHFQIEFYFSDSNLPRDRFLRDTVAANEEGYVDLSLLCSFSRIQSILGFPPAPKSTKPESNMTPELLSAVADVLRTAESLTVNEAGTQVKRKQVISQTQASEICGRAS